MTDQGLHPLVVKGAVIRELYPRGSLRPSIDEDILIREEEAEACSALLVREGFSQVLPEQSFRTSSEISYENRERHLYLEVHKTLFPEESSSYGRLNALFDHVWDNTEVQPVNRVSLYTLGADDHLLYLILHAYKHFLYSGVGIRPLCDIGLYAERYEKQINWTRLRDCLEKAHAFVFACALFRIIELYLLRDAAFFRNLAEWKLEEQDPVPLLQDILDGGLHGSATLVRRHSAGITLKAVENDRQGKKQNESLLSLIFPPAKSLTGRYPYLIRNPVLLPFAWGQRLLHYAAEVKNSSGTGTAEESLAIGRKRIELLRQYGIIDS